MTKENSLLRNALTSLLLLMIGATIGFNMGQRTPANGFSPKSILTGFSQPAEYRGVNFDEFWEVWGILNESYLDPEKLDAEKQVHGAIKGMTDSLGDPYTIYLPPTEQKRSSEDLAGAFHGVGIQLGYKDQTLAVIAPLKGTPAEQAGVKAGDLILHLKDSKKGIDENTVDMTLNDAVDKIRGEKGDPITLTLAREGVDRPFDVTLARDEIVVPSVEVSYIDHNGKQVAHIQLSRFGGRTDQEWNAIVTDISNKPQVSGIILDLRNNPGGYLEGAIDIASEFISEGVVVSQAGREEKQEYKVNRQGRLTKQPIEVLINKGSASASEIVAGALRDRRQAKLIGENSFGKGTVQDALELKTGAGLHVTVGRWLLPSGEWIHEKGLPVDIEITDNPETEQDEVLQKALETL